MNRLVPLVLGVVTGCAHASAFPSDQAARPATSVPLRFVWDATGYNADSTGQPACRTPMIDPRDQSRLTLVRAVASKRGDYAVTDGHYGVGQNELLRINCLTSTAIGIVPR